MDPWRIRRILRVFGNLRYPRSQRLLDRAIWWGTMVSLLLALAAVFLVQTFGDRWWPATVLLFGPRWILLVPFGFLLPLILLRDRALLPLLLGGILMVLGPVMGVEVGWPSLREPGGTGTSMTLVTLNARGGQGLFTRPGNLLREWRADVVAFQECGVDLSEALANIPGWYAHSRSGLCLLSRYEILGVMEMDREALEFAGGAGVVITYRLAFGDAPVYLTNLHLETPRRGFELIRSGRLRAGIQMVRDKSLLRGVELRRARMWTESFEGPHLVVGDFNTPVESRAYRSSWSDWQNAFSRKGTGLGGTRLNGWIRVRIDHILANEYWRVEASWVEDDAGSDHLPMAAHLSLR